MVGVALLCGALVAGAAEGPRGDDREGYKALAEKAVKDADAQVKLALWCEAHGMEAERVKHLGMAVLLDPGHAAARGLLGFLRDGDRWRRFDRAPAAEASPEALAAYEAKRADAPKTARGQFELARWCEQHGLKPEAVAHYTSATRIDPNYEPAWKALGCRKHRGQWLNDEQYAAAVAEEAAQRKADGVWVDRLGRWKRQMNQPHTRARAEAGFAAVDDPRAVPAVLRVLGDGRQPAQAMAVAILARIDTPASSKALAEFVARSPFFAVGRDAEAALVGRDAREVVEPLIDLLHGPLTLTLQAPEPDGRPGVLTVGNDRMVVRRVYVPPPSQRLEREPARPTPTWAGALTSLFFNAAPPPPRLVPDGVVRAEEALNRDANRAERFVAAERQQDENVRRVLRRVTGEDRGIDPDAWRSWWADQRGYAYDPPRSRAPRVVRQLVMVPPTPTRLHHSCFAAGTPVRTAAGPRPIEAIEVGDRVLAQDTATGALSYQPVVAVFHNPPNATLKIDLGDDAVVATPIHRFWVAGRGWALARELKPGDLIRTAGGTARVAAVADDAVQPVFNLEVAAGHSFFVGRAAALVHDHSLLGPPAQAFDAR